MTHTEVKVFTTTTTTPTPTPTPPPHHRRDNDGEEVVNVRLMEVNVRQQNDNFVPLCQMCIGYNALDMWLSALLDDDNDNEEEEEKTSLFDSIPRRPRLVRSGSVVSLVCYADGTLTNIRHLDEIRNLESVVHVQVYPQFAEPGNAVERSRDIRTDAGYIHLVNDDECAMRRDYDAICEYMYTMFEVKEEEQEEKKKKK
uniref:Uncharacterized protein n=1 Tax=Odontella aurita TaxID=265563 RepID=A0A7S4JX60_9STRA